MGRRLGVLAALIVALAACSNPPTHGYVWSINYEPPSSLYWPGHSYQSCSGTGSSRVCYSQWVPGYVQYIPEEWQLDLCQKPGKPADGNPCGWRDVDQQTYHSVTLGQYWTTEAS